MMADQAQPTTSAAAAPRSIIIRHDRRRWQRECHAGMSSHRWSVVVAHRRAGKTVEIVTRLIECAAAARGGSPAASYGYIAPQLGQAKAIAWPYLRRACQQIPGIRINEQELSITLPHNGARIRVYGADNPDALRGLYWDGVALDEVAQMRPQVWGEVIRPALSDRSGWAVFIGTPKGVNLFSELYHAALKDTNWFAALYDVYATGVLPPDEIERLRASMSDSQFRQEFLCDFAAAVENSVLSFEAVRAAASRKVPPHAYQHAPVVVGVDPARFGGDRTSVCVRQGIAVVSLAAHRDLDVMQVAGLSADMSARLRPDALLVDDGGLGAGVVDRLNQLGVPVVPVSSAGKPDDPRYANKRAEMWMRMAEWLRIGGCIPDDPALHADLLGPSYLYDSNNRILIESKDAMRKRGRPSPDMADALALTFAEMVHPRPVDRAILEDGNYGAVSRAYDPKRFSRTQGRGGRAA